MGTYPIDKNMGQDYRDSLLVPDAPQFIETDNIMPVVVVNSGLARPRSNQVVKAFSISKGAAADTQVATATPNKKIYFLGINYAMLAGGGLVISDATSGTNALGDGDTNDIFYMSVSATTNDEKFKPFPVQCQQGIRVSNTGAFGFAAIVFYIEETVIR